MAAPRRSRMKDAVTAVRNKWVSVIAAFTGFVVTAVLMVFIARPASTYIDPNMLDLGVHNFQDALDVAILKCALGRPDCVGTTQTSGGSVTVTFDGSNYALRIQPGGLPPIIAEKIKGKDMQRFRDQMALANSLSPGMDPNTPAAVSDHTPFTGDPNDVIGNAMRIGSTLSMKIRTGDGRKGVMTVQASPSLAVRWSLQLK
jgi:hypothetical protein